MTLALDFIRLLLRWFLAGVVVAVTLALLLAYWISPRD